MQVELDFDVFKALTLLRKNENDTINEVIRRLIEQGNQGNEATHKRGLFRKAGKRKTEFSEILSEIGNEQPETRNAPEMDGIWIANSFLPNGTRLRATYKGRSYHAAIIEGEWRDEEGERHNNPSAAARAVTGNNVNGWRFWHALLPGEKEWRRMDHYKKG